MFNKTLRWILPFLVIALIAVYLVLAPASLHPRRSTTEPTTPECNA